MIHLDRNEIRTLVGSMFLGAILISLATVHVSLFLVGFSIVLITIALMLVMQEVNGLVSYHSSYAMRRYWFIEMMRDEARWEPPFDEMDVAGTALDVARDALLQAERHSSPISVRLAKWLVIA